MQRLLVEAFLKALREAINKNGLHVIPRASNNQALLDLGLTPKLREEIILNFQCDNYAKGPLPDDQGKP
ncbi:toxin, partial [bacterium]|nr:toxin [bacterium]